MATTPKPWDAADDAYDDAVMAYREARTELDKRRAADAVLVALMRMTVVWERIRDGHAEKRRAA